MKIQVIKQQREFRRRLGGGVLVEFSTCWEGSTCRAIWAVISNRNQIHYQESHLSVRRRFGDWGVGRSTAFETCKTEGKLGEGDALAVQGAEDWTMEEERPSSSPHIRPFTNLPMASPELRSPLFPTAITVPKSVPPSTLYCDSFIEVLSPLL